MGPKVLDLRICQSEAKRLSGGMKELAQLTLLFHVEQIRETQNDVKAFLLWTPGILKNAWGC